MHNVPHVSMLCNYAWSDIHNVQVAGIHIVVYLLYCVYNGNICSNVLRVIPNICTPLCSAQLCVCICCMCMCVMCVCVSCCGTSILYEFLAVCYCFRLVEFKLTF